ncbi:hypothetical protein GW17_00047716 [Ensete ventricosum]|nr:hypothetical protein GW17_00047716 [Ensete ventricosum]
MALTGGGDGEGHVMGDIGLRVRRVYLSGTWILTTPPTAASMSDPSLSLFPSSSPPLAFPLPSKTSSPATSLCMQDIPGTRTMRRPLTSPLSAAITRTVFFVSATTVKGRHRTTAHSAGTMDDDSAPSHRRPAN